MSTINLVKGEKIDLSKGKQLAVVGLGGGWDINPSAQTGGKTYDLDLFAVAMDAANKPIPGQVVYFNDMKKIEGLELEGDNLTGEGDGDDETINITLAAIKPEVQSIVVAINIYDAVNKGQRFGMVQNSFVRLYNKETNEELVQFNLGENYGSHTGVIAGKLYRHEGEWKFEAIGEGVDGSITDIVAHLNK